MKNNCGMILLHQIDKSNLLVEENSRLAGKDWRSHCF